MDASQYKDYVLFMLFIKYISDKYGNSVDFAPPVTIPKGASFTDMVALKGKSDIGDRINTQIIQHVDVLGDEVTNRVGARVVARGRYGISSHVAWSLIRLDVAGGQSAGRPQCSRQSDAMSS